MLRHPLLSVAPPAPAAAIDAEDVGGGGARNHTNSMVVVTAEAVRTNGGPQSGVVAPALATDRGGDTVECSSSFGGTSSGLEGEADGSEPEVDSVVSTGRATGGGYSKLPRRKTVTAEWRNSVLPILWRCQWLELRMKELSSQVSKYDWELALIEKEKELQQEVSTANGSRLESRQIMKRRKRKRREENVDAALYFNKHQILSYFHDKQNKGAETGGILIDDDCGSTVDGCIRGGLDTITLLNSKNYDMIFEQLILKHTLMTIDGLQSRVYLLQDRLSKAHSEGENLVISEYGSHVRVPRKMQQTQKHPFSYTECQCTKPRKRKNLNVFLKDDDGSAPAVRPALPDRETDAHIKDANRNAEDRSGECNHLREKYVTMDVLLGTDNSIPIDHIGDLCKENTYDILIDNPAAIAHQQFGKAKHLHSVTSSKGPAETKNISTPAEVKNTCAPVDSTSAPAVEPVSPQSKKELKPKKMRKIGSFFTKKKKKKKKKETSKSPAKEEAEDTPSAAENKTGSTPSAAAVEKTERTPSGATGLGTMTPRRPLTAGKKRKTVNEFADVKKRESAPLKKQKTGRSPSSAAENKTGSTPSAAAVEKTGSMPSGPTGMGTMAPRRPLTAGKKRKTVNEFADVKKRESAPLEKQKNGRSPSSAAKKQDTGKPFSAAKKQETGKPSSAAKKQESGKPSSATKNQKTENPSSAAKKQVTANPSSAEKKQGTANAPYATKETESALLNVKTEEAVLAVAVNSRRSQRVRKPKVFSE